MVSAHYVFSLTIEEIKKSPVVIAQLLWQPFNVRFANILQRLDHHRAILKSEIELLHLKASVKSLDKETMILDNQTTMQHYQADIEKHLKGYNLTLSDMQKRFSGHEHGKDSMHVGERLLINFSITLRKGHSVDTFSRICQHIRVE